MNFGPRKICLVGSFFVGKTSAVTRFHSNTFSEKYLATVGVSVNTRDVVVDEGRTVKLVIWDLASMEDLTPLNINYLKNSAGIAYVVDSTRRATLGQALFLKKKIDESFNGLPSIMLVNKIDLAEEREITADDLETIKAAGLRYFETSALTGEGVTEAFTNLAASVI